MKIVREAYQTLKNRIGEVPTLYSFIEHRSIDPEVIFKLNGINNYPEFLHKMKESVPSIGKRELEVLTMFSLELLNGKRIHEIILIELLLQYNGKVSPAFYEQAIIKEGLYYDEETMRSVQRLLDLSFYTKPDQRKYGNKSIILYESDCIQFDSSVKGSMQADNYFIACVKDIIKVAKAKHKKYKQNSALTLYEKY